MRVPLLLPLLGAAAAAGCAAGRGPPGFPGAAELPLAAAAVPAAALPEDPYAPRTPRSAAHDWEEWERVRTTVMPYAWRTASEGEVRAGGIPGPADEDPGDATLGGRIEAAHQGVALFAEGFYAHAGDLEAGVEGDVRYGMFQFGAAQRLGAGEYPGPSNRGAPVAPFLDALAGVRFHAANAHVDPPGFAVGDSDFQWGEITLGARAGFTVLGFLTPYAAADGGGMYTNWWWSRSWNAEAGVKVSFGEAIGLVAGYRWYGAFFDDDDDDGVDETGLDLRLQGVFGGLVIGF